MGGEAVGACGDADPKRGRKKGQEVKHKFPICNSLEINLFLHASFDGGRHLSRSSVAPLPHWSDISMEDSQLESPDSEEEKSHAEGLLQADSVAPTGLSKES